MVATLMATDFYLLQRCSSPQLHKFEALISFHAQDDFGYELGEDYHNKICKSYLIQISQESAHTTGLLEKYIQHLDLCHIIQLAYQILTMVASETNIKLYYPQLKLSTLDPPSHSLCFLLEIKNNFWRAYMQDLSWFISAMKPTVMLSLL